MSAGSIRIRGARTHNLRNIDLELPRDRLIVITGLSGSGKSSLAFDTIYAEGQRRYVESLSAYARQFLSMMEKPDVDHIEGLSPAISIEQKSTSHNPRSTVGTITEIYDYLRLLFARVGMPRCPDHGIDLAAQTVSQMVDQVLALPEGTRAHAARAGRSRSARASTQQVIEELRGQGFVRARVDGDVVELDAAAEARLRRRKHTIEAVVDRVARCATTSRSAWRSRSRPRCRLATAWRASRSWTSRSARSWCSPKFACPHLRLQPRRTRAAPVLVQQSRGRLPDVRRPRRQAVLRSRRASSRTRSCRSPAARCAAGTAATPTTSS